MNDSDFLKGACGSCQGHLEFPAYALGITTTCPHCGIETRLVAPADTTVTPPPAEESPAPASTHITPAEAPPTGAKLKKVLTVVGSVLVGLVVLAFIGLKVWKTFRRAGNVVETVNGGSKPEQPKPAESSSQRPGPAASATSAGIAKGTAPARKPGEDLQVLSFAVQKANDGNLQYLVGVVTNHSAKQFFNVKLEFELTRKDGKPGDLATDTLRNLPANTAVPFKTSIIGTAHVTNAKLAKLEGEKE